MGGSIVLPLLVHIFLVLLVGLASVANIDVMEIIAR